MSCNDDKTYEPCSCGCGGNSDCTCDCNECAPVNCIEQAIRDALAALKAELEALVKRAEDAATASEASATASADSAAEAKGYRDGAQLAATTATEALKTITDVASTLEDTANKLKDIADQLNTALAGIAVATWYYTTVEENQTVITIPDDKNAMSVQAIYIEGARQEPGANRNFVHDKAAKTITLGTPVAKGIELVIILGTYSDNPLDFSNILASNNGASLVGTTDGVTVQNVLNTIKNSISTLLNFNAELATPAGANSVGYDRDYAYSPDTVGAKLSAIFAFLPQVNIADYPTLKAAIAALPNGGTVYIPIGRWKSGSWDTTANSMTTPNIRLLGEQAPQYNSTLTRLTGSVICDRFISHAHNFSAINVGFDAGRDFIMETYPTADTRTPSHPDGGTWDAFVYGAPAENTPQKIGFTLVNVIGLMYDSLAIGHAVLTECYCQGRLDNVVGIYGYHGVIIKASDVVATSIYSYGQSKNGLIIKADQFSDCGNVAVHDHTHGYQPRNTSPWSQPLYADHALDIDPNAKSFNGPIYIGKTSSSGAVMHIHFGGLKPLADVHIGSVVTDGLAANSAVVGEYSAIIDGSTTASRVYIGHLRVSNCKQGIYNATPQSNPAQQLTIGRMEAVNITNAAIYALDNAIITVAQLDVFNVGSLYFMTPTGHIYVGDEKYNLIVNSKFLASGGGTAPTLNPQWSVPQGEENFEISLKNYRVSAKGFVQPGSGATSDIVSLPGSLRPKSSPRIPGVGIQNGAVSAMAFSITNAIRTGDGGALPTGLQFVSLSGLEWDY